jgi:anion-transporting  ArsA/GET3 family ATPase
LTPEALVEDKRIVVCVGTGGVGKTTVAAAMALEAARRGRRALVLTIDPARRLADALGVHALGNEPAEVATEKRAALGIAGDGRLFAMMLDMKRTFDDLVLRFGESPEAVDRIIRNPIYQHVSDALAGSAEYAAMEKVYELCESGAYDLVVVDTPPSQHALDFLEAPQRLLEFLDSRIVKMLLHPAFAAGRFGFRLFQRTTQRILQLFERVSGIAFLEDISEFLLAFEGMSEGFRERAERVRAMLLGPDSGFVLVAGPSREAARGADAFLTDLERSRVPLVGVIVNRFHAWPNGVLESDVPSFEEDALEKGVAALERAFASQDGEANAAELARAAAELTSRYASVVRLDLQNTAPLKLRATEVGAFFRGVPELPRDVHDFEGLGQVASHVFRAVAKSDEGTEQ